MVKTVWGIFVVDRNNVFPNFAPIGVYSSKEKAEKQIDELPKEQPYQLFEIPIDEFLAEITKDGKVKSRLGKLQHFHFEGDQ